MIIQQINFKNYLEQYNPLEIYNCNIGVYVEEEPTYNYIDIAKNLLIEQYKNKPNINYILEAIISPFQELGIVLEEIIESRNLDTANGYSLDMIGDRVGVERGTMSDNEFRLEIKFQIILNRSNGEPETLIYALKFLANATIVHYSEPHPATVFLMYQSLELPPSGLLSRMQKIAPAGVKVIIGYANNLDKILSFGAEGGFSPHANTAGFSDSASFNDGGQFLELLS